LSVAGPVGLAALLIAGGPLAGTSSAVAQEKGDPARVLEVGELAPDFELTGATRFGVLETPVRLSDLRGKTVVLAFFFKVRTKG
jgi:cytochrome oxidase Cu insertion factor (SCO1/SenC/PrrC family)